MCHCTRNQKIEKKNSSQFNSMAILLSTRKIEEYFLSILKQFVDGDNLINK
jgi:hypothetical protein